MYNSKQLKQRQQRSDANCNIYFTQLLQTNRRLHNNRLLPSNCMRNAISDLSACCSDILSSSAVFSWTVICRQHNSRKKEKCWTLWIVQYHDVALQIKYRKENIRSGKHCLQKSGSKWRHFHHFTAFRTLNEWHKKSCDRFNHFSWL